MAFGADLRRFWAMNSDRMNKIMKASVTEIVGNMQQKSPGVTIGGALTPGRMPYVTEELVNSLTMSVGTSTAVGELAYVSAMRNYQNGDAIQIYWDTIYAKYIEYGDEKFPGWHFMGNNMLDWQEIVYANARKYRNRYR